MAKAGNTVTVALKHPHGIIMRVYGWEEFDEPILGGGMRTVRRSVEVGERYPIYGNAAPFGQATKAPVVAGYALTGGVPQEVWDLWLKQNQDSDLVRNSLIMAYPKISAAQAAAKDHATTRSGLEPLSTGTKVVGNRQVHTDPRWPRSANPNLAEIGTDDRR